MDIQVKDFSRALSSCETVSKYVNELNGHVDALEDILVKVKTKWESTGQDKESYMVELEKQVSNLTFINQQIDTFVKQIRNYVHSVQETSKKSI